MLNTFDPHALTDLDHARETIRELLNLVETLNRARSYLPAWRLAGTDRAFPGLLR